MSALPPGKWFNPSEFTCRDGTPYPEDWEDRWLLIRDLCDQIRELWGGPLIVQSGYRSPKWNARLLEDSVNTGSHGVASSSQHVQGRAADLRTRLGKVDVPHLYRVILNSQRDGLLPLLGGVAMYPVSGWVHVDVEKAPDGHLRRWTGT